MNTPKKLNSSLKWDPTDQSKYNNYNEGGMDQLDFF